MLIRIGSVIATVYVLWIGALAQITGNAALWLASHVKSEALEGFAAWARSYTANWHLDISVFIAVTFPIAFLTTTARRGRDRLSWTDVALAALSFGAALYYIVLDDKFLNWSRGFSQPTLADIAVGLVLLGLVLELCRRSTGWGLTTLVVVLLVFTVFGRWMPGALHHDNFGIVYFTEMMTITENGIFGAPLQVEIGRAHV